VHAWVPIKQVRGIGPTALRLRLQGMGGGKGEGVGFDRSDGVCSRVTGSSGSERLVLIIRLHEAVNPRHHDLYEKYSHE
jgi:hypothetical protein